MKLGFIGAGNMATAIIKGLLAKNFLPATDIYITTSSSEHTETVAKNLGIQSAHSNADLIEIADTVIIAVKPHIAPIILNEQRELLTKRKSVLISIASGLTLENLAELTSSEQKIVKVMPNMNVSIGQSVSAICGNQLITKEELDLVAALFNVVGSTYEIAEKDFRNFTALAGCSPAFTYLYIDAMSRAGVKNGLPKAMATKIAAEAVKGSAQMVLDSEDTPWDLIDKVCSPGGTTIAGLVALEEEHFMATVIKGLEATIKRDQELEG
ncbi:pyrroline-5-carboxylate reductase [Vagococcus sp. BWB3-3]|uniref:Pyrroline-5-carboxylate reductase n=1 Tax=Vagococcus allomyrinae TaxID=2794353 RepID=A0A940P1U3_9ENTE|nr:pyrroline-5-carboxylate reductase [Vagococcus allomyrinae]MBP1039904.1 pyrroline-5-carboxylate reductase [Vagococcus allomyrinae]